MHKKHKYHEMEEGHLDPHHKRRGTSHHTRMLQSGPTKGKNTYISKKVAEPMLKEAERKAKSHRLKKSEHKKTKGVSLVKTIQHARKHFSSHRGVGEGKQATMTMKK